MSYSADDGAHGRTFMRTNDANDDPPNSRRPSLQTITPVALIFSWLLFDGTTRKCIIRRWCSSTAIVVEVLRLESRLFPLSLFLPRFLSPLPSSTPRCSPFGAPRSFASLSNLLWRPRRRRERDTYSNSRINYEQRRAFVRKGIEPLDRRRWKRRSYRTILTRANTLLRTYITIAATWRAQNGLASNGGSSRYQLAPSGSSPNANTS